jgi:hypothetical protein
MVTLNAPDGSVVITIPDTLPVILNVPDTDEVVVPVAGPTGGLGPEGPPGPPGPVGNLDEDLPDLVLILENGLI